MYKRIHISIILLALLVLTGGLGATPAKAFTTLTPFSGAFTTSVSSATGVSFTFTASGQNTTQSIKCITAAFSTIMDGSVIPTGMALTGVVPTGNFITPGNWGTAAGAGTYQLKWTYATGEIPPSGTGRTFTFGGITNGSVVGTSYYAAFTTFTDASCTLPAGGGQDYATAPFAFTNGVVVTGTVPPTLTFTVNSTTCALGMLGVTAPKSCSHGITAATNGSGGYSISYLAAATLTSGIDIITNLSSLTASAAGSPQFGLNLRANAGPIGGTDPSGGYTYAKIAAGYSTVDSYKFATAGDTVVTVPSGTPLASTTYTVAYMANISSVTAAGVYSTTMVYTILPSY